MNFKICKENYIFFNFLDSNISFFNYVQAKLLFEILLFFIHSTNIILLQILYTKIVHTIFPHKNYTKDAPSTTLGAKNMKAMCSIHRELTILWMRKVRNQFSRESCCDRGVCLKDMM